MLPVEGLGQDRPDLRGPVIHIGTSETERNDLAPVIADQMQFEAMATSHRPFPISSQTFVHLVGITSEIVADRHHRGVHKTDACTTTKDGEVKKEHHLEKHAALEFHESVVGYGIGEIELQMLPDEEQVVMFEIAERTKLEHYQNGHNLNVGEGCLAIATRLTIRGHKRLFVYLLIKFFAKFIHSTENFCNFVVGNYEFIPLFDFISDWNSDIKAQKNISDYHLFMRLSYPELG